MAILKTFKLKATCIKCGTTGPHHARWGRFVMGDVDGVTLLAQAIGGTKHPEAIQRTCMVCGFEWLETCVDDPHRLRHYKYTSPGPCPRQTLLCSSKCMSDTDRCPHLEERDL